MSSMDLETTSGQDLRIVSLLPSATEMACALGLSDQLVGITHCCDYPPEIVDKPIVVHGNIPVEKLELREIDQVVSAALSRGESLYHVDEHFLQKLEPTHILTQDLCQVCAPAGNEVNGALNHLREQPKVLWMSPHSIQQIEGDIRDLGAATGHEIRAEALIAHGQRRLQTIQDRLGKRKSRPRVFCAEWIDPLFCAGHWVPEMVEIAGGNELLGRKWKDSVRLTWESVCYANPEILIFMPCGFASQDAHEQANWLKDQEGFSELSAVKNDAVYAVDGGYFNRPGPRVIDGTELLAHLLHPDLFSWNGPSDAFIKVDCRS